MPAVGYTSPHADEDCRALPLECSRHPSTEFQGNRQKK